MAASADAQTFTVDFSRWTDPPLVKTKFGVYQTPLIARGRLLASLPRLGEIGVQDLRYEIAWGKPDALAFDQISGTPEAPHLDFLPLDQLLTGLTAWDVRPLLALTYCPVPLQARHDWAAWKDLPSSLPAWSQIVQAYAAHVRRTDHLRGPYYEVWNEPDIPGPNGKIFFSGSPNDYHRLYAATAPAVHAGDDDALVGGAAIAYDFRYFTPILAEPLDFGSLHAYDNFRGQVAAMQAALQDRPDLPIFLTEYASFTTFGKDAPVSRYPAAERFFRDVRGMLAVPDLTKVYWAQWMDDDLGLLTRDLHRKALFNAFKVYGQMPVDRVAVTPDSADGVGAMASADEHDAAAVFWNENLSERIVTVHLAHLPFAHGTLQLCRIDRSHASSIDNPTTENLSVQEAHSVGSDATWTGTIPGESVVFLRAFAVRPLSRRPPGRIGVFVRADRWFFDRSSPAYADFDPRTSIARVGMGDRDFGVAQIGAVLDEPAPRIRVQMKTAGPFVSEDPNSLFALRVDFPDRTGRYHKSILYHGTLYDSRRDSRLPWGAGGATADVVDPQPAMNRGRSFLVDLSQVAPPDWSHKRALLSFILQNAGRGSRARFILTAAATAHRPPEEVSHGPKLH